MEHDAQAVANSLIVRSLKDGNPLTPLQIIKLVYFCHGWMLGLYGRGLIRQQIQAWRYGPVIADVYHALKRYRDNPVRDHIDVPTEEFDELESDVIGQVYEKYGGLNGITLSRLTHAPGTPWDQVWSQEEKNSVIPNILIQEHYASMAG